MPSIAWFPFAIVLSACPRHVLFVMVGAASRSPRTDHRGGYTPPLLLRPAGKTMGCAASRLCPARDLQRRGPRTWAGMKQGWAFAWRSLMAGRACWC